MTDEGTLTTTTPAGVSFAALPQAIAALAARCEAGEGEGER